MYYFSRKTWQKIVLHFSKTMAVFINIGVTSTVILIISGFIASLVYSISSSSSSHASPESMRTALVTMGVVAAVLSLIALWAYVRLRR